MYNVQQDTIKVLDFLVNYLFVLKHRLILTSAYDLIQYEYAKNFKKTTGY